MWMVWEDIRMIRGRYLKENEDMVKERWWRVTDTNSWLHKCGCKEED